MIYFSNLVKNEETADIIAFLVHKENGFGYPKMDGNFSHHNFSVVENGEFMQIFKTLEENKIIDWGDKMNVKKAQTGKHQRS